jgi:hypothetical protein
LEERSEKGNWHSSKRMCGRGKGRNVRVVPAEMEYSRGTKVR